MMSLLQVSTISINTNTIRVHVYFKKKMKLNVNYFYVSWSHKNITFPPSLVANGKLPIWKQDGAPLLQVSTILINTNTIRVRIYFKRKKNTIKCEFFLLMVESLNSYVSTVIIRERSVADLKTRRCPTITSIYYIDQHQCSPCSHIFQAKKWNSMWIIFIFHRASRNVPFPPSLVTNDQLPI